MEERPKRTYGYIKGNDEKSQYHRSEAKKIPKSERSIIKSFFLLPFTLIKILFSGFAFILTLGRIKKPSHPKENKSPIGPKILKFFKYSIIAGIILLAGLTAWTAKDLPDINDLKSRKVSQSTKIFDRTGNHLLYEIFADQRRTIVELSDIPKDLINGAIATEDTQFYDHHGVRPASILRALVYGMLPGRRVAGTSTLTQQLVKNAILTNERTIFRKGREILLSLLLEQKYSKDEILKIYFNEIPYGSTNYGVESAAQSYFGKHVSELTLAESATLAGIPKAPTTYLNNKEKLKERRDFVLRRMQEEKYITMEQKEAAQAEPLTINPRYKDIQAPHFVLYVKEQLVSQFGEQQVETGGLKVITSLDYDKQILAENSFAKYTELLSDAGGNNAALVSLDPKTAQILALVGSRDFFDEKIDGQFNVAIDARRQPGSSIKPIIYAAAFEKGYTPDTILFDVSTNFSLSDKSYTPQNYDLQERGPVTMRQSLQGSLNIPAVQTFYLVGEKKGIEFANRLGYSTFENGNFGLSLVLGGGSVSMLEHANAYGTFANNGVYHQPISILKVTSPDGDTLFEWKEDKGKQVVSKEVSATLSNVLSDDAARAYVFGAGGPLTLKDRPVAAKTGTTNEYKDAWAVGYTPSLVAVVWAGNTDNTKMKAGYGGSKVAAQIWNEYMTEVTKNTPIESFQTPPINDAEKAILRGSTDGGITVKIDKITGKLATTSTPEKYVIEKTYLQPHSILHYVNKDDPRGPVPTNPETDSQYSVWEAAIQDWITRRKEKDPTWDVSFEEPPTEYDDAHSLELIPTLEIIYPIASSTLDSRRMDTDIRVSATRGVTKVSYKIDSKFVGVVREHPFNLNYTMRGLENGPHTLTIMVEDDIGNLLEEAITFTLAAPEETPGVFWNVQDKTLSSSAFPRTLLLSPLKLDKIQSVKIYAQKTGDDNKQLIGSITDLNSLMDGQLPFVWDTKPEPGLWTLSAEVTVSGNSYTSDNTSIEVTN